MADGVARSASVFTDGESDGFVPMFAFFDAVKEPFINWSSSVKGSGDKEIAYGNEVALVAVEPGMADTDTPRCIDDTNEASACLLFSEADLVGA